MTKEETRNASVALGKIRDRQPRHRLMEYFTVLGHGALSRPFPPALNSR